MKYLLNKITLLSLSFLTLFLLVACEGFLEFGNDEKENGLSGNSVGTSEYFDSFVQANIYHTLTDEEFSEVADEFHNILGHLHRVGTRHDSYEDQDIVNVKTINENPGVWHEVDDALFDMIMLSIDYYEYTNGYFDITLGPVIDIWDEYTLDCQDFLSRMAGASDREERMENEYDDHCRIPSTEELEAANEFVGIDKLKIDEDNQRVKIQEGMLLDLGGIGKGYAAKELGDYLKSVDGIESFLINAGTSNVEVYGDHPQRENKMWYTGITNPDSPNNPQNRIGSLQITSGDNVTTSGDYQRYYEVDGRKYHHLIDPNTLFPTDHHKSVTLVSSDGAIGDLLVTAIFIMPLEEGLDFVNERDDLEALWYIDENTIEMSDDLEEKYVRDLSLSGIEDDSLVDDNMAIMIALFLPGILLIIFSVLTLLYKNDIIKLPKFLTKEE